MIVVVVVVVVVVVAVEAAVVVVVVVVVRRGAQAACPMASAVQHAAERQPQPPTTDGLVHLKPPCVNH